MAEQPRPEAKLEVDNSDFNAMIREQLNEPVGGDYQKPPERVEADKPERSEEDLKPQSPRPPEAREPEVTVEPAVTEPSEPSGRPSPTVQTEEVTRALSTISNLERQVAELRRERDSFVAAPRREPQVEFTEVLPGVQLPKDQKLWPVQLTPDLVKAAGLDPEVAPGLNILANAFLLHINNMLTPTILGQVDQTYRSRETANASVNAFFSRFPDLRDKQDLLELVESRARETDRIHEKYAGSDYMDQIGLRTRQRLAALRGQTVEQYAASVHTNAAPAAPSAASRATTAPARRAARNAPSTASQRELDDMLVKE